MPDLTYYQHKLNKHGKVDFDTTGLMTASAYIVTVQELEEIDTELRADAYNQVANWKLYTLAAWGLVLVFGLVAVALFASASDAALRGDNAEAKADGLRRYVQQRDADVAGLRAQVTSLTQALTARVAGAPAAAQDFETLERALRATPKASACRVGYDPMDGAAGWYFACAGSGDLSYTQQTHNLPTLHAAVRAAQLTLLHETP